uniref:LITAF domain-containing protein n=1 Tax=Neogobius melanostomus TaxID=47308 RepID=A0A8C6S9S4_9GOBI
MAAFTRCPFCNRVVFTQTKTFNGDSAWLMCCVCSLGVVGLCFIPFCLDRTKSVKHSCPECQATIHTFHPF